MVGAKLQFTVETRRRIEAIDITDRLLAITAPEGLLSVRSPHTTVAVFLGEGDPDMLVDYERVGAEFLVPFEPFRHHRNNKPNAAAHIMSGLLGTSVLLSVDDHRIDLGNYQRVVLLELDGPHPGRKVLCASVPTTPLAVEWV